MKHEIGDFQTADGLRLREQSWLPDGAPNAAIILHHGLWDYSDYYASFAEELTKQNFAVFAFDIRGHGNSEGARYFVNSFDEYISDLDIFIKRVGKKLNGKPIFLYGHSLGGLVAATYGVTYPKNDLRGFIISGAGLKPGKDVTPVLKAIVPIISAIAPKLPSYKPDFKFASRDSSVGERKGKDPLIDQKGLPARSGAAGLKAMANVQAKYEQFISPVFIIHGTDDHWTNIEGSQEFNQRAASKDKTLKLYEGFYHELLSDTNKALVWKDITKWMSERV